MRSHAWIAAIYHMLGSPGKALNIMNLPATFAESVRTRTLSEGGTDLRIDVPLRFEQLA